MVSSFIGIIIRHHMFRDSTVIAITQAITILIFMLQGVIIARTLSLTDMGYFQLILSFIAIGRITALPGMDAVIVKGVLKNYDQVYFVAMRRSISMALIISLVVVAIAYVIWHFYPSSKIGPILLVTGIFLPLSGMEKYESLLQGKRDFILSRKIAIISSICQLLMVGFAACYTRDLICILVSLFINRLVTNAICIFYLRKKIVRHPLDETFEKALMVQGWRMSGVYVFNLVVAQIDRLVLGALDAKLLALYHIGAVLPRRIKDNVKNLLVVPTTHWSKLSKREHISKVQRYIAGIATIGVLLVLVIWFSSPYLIPLLYGEIYRQSVSYAQILSLGIPALLLANIIEMININQDNGIYYQNTLFIKQIFYLSLLAVLVPNYGIMGIILSILLRDFMNLSMQLVYLFRN